MKKIILSIGIIILSVAIASAQVWTAFVTPTVAGNDVRTIKKNQSGNLWLGFGGTTSNGISLYNGASFSNTNLGGINEVNDIYFDNDTTWLCTYGAGVLRFVNGTNVSSLTVTDGLSSNYINCMAIDTGGNKWFGSHNNGITFMSDDTIIIYNMASGLPNNTISKIFISSDSTLWFGTWGSGLLRKDVTGFTTFNSSNSGLEGDSIFAFAEDSLGVIWLATSRGLSRLDSSGIITMTSNLPDLYVQSILIDEYGNKWIGTYGGIVYSYGDSIYESYTNQNTNGALVHNTVQTLRQDNSGNIWMGTAGGLLKMKPSNIYILGTSSNQLCLDTVSVVGVAISPAKIEINAISRNGDSLQYSVGGAYQASSVFSPILPGTYYCSVNWSTGESAQTITVDTTGNYWVEVVDVNHCMLTDTVTIWIDSISFINEYGAKIEILCYPNPTNTSMWIECDGYTGPVSLEIFDLYGRRLKNKNIQEFPVRVRLSSYEEGAYILVLKTNTGRYVREVIIKR